MVIAITGKGGSGKTLLATILIRILTRELKKKVLAIDADPATSLPYALGAEPIRTISEVREELISDPYKRKALLGNHVGYLIKNLIINCEGFDLLIMGRSEGPGCYCALNELLKYGIEFISKDYDVTVIDGEAGLEQINRRVLENVDILIIVSEPTARSLQTAKTISKVANVRRAREVRKGLVLNRVKEIDQLVIDRMKDMDVEYLGYILEDENVTKYDLIGKPLIDIPQDSNCVGSVRKIMERIGIQK